MIIDYSVKNRKKSVGIQGDNMKLKWKIVTGIASVCLGVTAGIKDYQAADTINQVRLDGIFAMELGVPGNSAQAGERVVTVTNNTSQKGAVWSVENNLLDFTENFHMISYVNQSKIGNSELADGMVFVVQGYNAKPTWFTAMGGSLGALPTNIKQDGLIGIPNSIGVEFDLYGNNNATDGYFDKGTIGTPHAAVVYPGGGLNVGYTQNSLIWGNYKVITHDGAMTYPTGADIWNKLEMDWKLDEANPNDITKGKLTFTLNGQNMSFSQEKFQNLVLKNGTVSKAYWGYTGATGPTYSAKQQIYFEQVPGLVNAETAINLYDSNNQPILEGTLLKGLSVVNVELSAKWLSGKQNWDELSVQTELPGSLEIIEGTTEVNGKKPVENPWIGNKLTTKVGDIPNLGTYNDATQQEAKVTFQARVKSTASANQQITADFNGDNAFYDGKSISFGTEKNDLSANFTNVKNNEVIFYDTSMGEGFTFPVSVDWISAWSKGTAKQKLSISQGNKNILVKEEGVEATKGTMNADLSEFIKGAIGTAQVDYGEFQLKYEITVTSEGVSQTFETSLTLFKRSKPYVFNVKLNDIVATPGTTVKVKLGDPITIAGQYIDFDSPNVSIYLKVGTEGKLIEMGPLTPPAIGENAEFSYKWDTTGMAIGEYPISIYAKDSEGNIGPETSLGKVVFDGELTLSVANPHFSVTDLVIGNEQSKKVENMGTVAIDDTRIVKGNWRLNVSLAENFTNKRESDGFTHVARDDFFSYHNGTAITPISKDSNSSLIKVGTEGAEKSEVDQSGENGFYFKSYDGLMIGNYEATVNWSFIDAPSP